MDRVKFLMREGNSFRYTFTEPYVATLPAVTQRTKSGDCKAKSLWIADKIGDREHIRFVIGKARSTSRISHAWLMWNDGSRWWILDPTNTSLPIPAESVARNEYIPLYSYDAHGCYRHAGTQLYASTSKSGDSVAGR
jgi:hypothetical protein